MNVFQFHFSFFYLILNMIRDIPSWVYITLGHTYHRHDITALPQLRHILAHTTTPRYIPMIVKRGCKCDTSFNQSINRNCHQDL